MDVMEDSRVDRSGNVGVVVEVVQGFLFFELECLSKLHIFHIFHILHGHLRLLESFLS
jgi:hypothetical protein